MPPLTPSQTVGPFFHIGLKRLSCDDLVPAGYPAPAITISGRILDGESKPVPDALLEVWQADQLGRYALNFLGDEMPPTFQGWGRIPTDFLGRFKLRTIKPGPVNGPSDAPQAPHINVAVFMRGLLRHLFTRIYFDDEPANQGDPVLLMVPQKRRQTLVATRGRRNHGNYRWNIILQGPGETVFFDW